ncbi:1129_t:CDS:2, partial [Dentiscutata heterogama]
VCDNVRSSDHDSDHDNDHNNNSDHSNDHNNDCNNDRNNDLNNNISTTNKGIFKSEVWQFFNRIVWLTERKTAKCKVPNCTHKEFSCGSGGGDIKEAFGRNSKSSSFTRLTNVDNIKLRDMFAAWVINRQRPFTIIEDPELIEIIQYLNPTAQLVKADAIKNAIMSLYSSGKRELKASFATYLIFKAMHTSLLSIPKSLSHEDWALQETVIDFGLIKGRHDGINLANGFFTVLKEYEITSK